MTIPAPKQYSSVRRLLFQVPLLLLDVLGFNRLFRFLTRRHIRVLMYHGIADMELGPSYWLMLSRSRFEWQMSYLEGEFEVCPWACLLEQPSTTPRSGQPRVVITFDDAFANVLRNARPILERHSYPAVCFVIPDLSERGEEIWTTKMFRLLFESDLTHIALKGPEPAGLSLPADRTLRKAAVSRYISSLKARATSEIQLILEQVSRICASDDSSAVAREFALMSIDEILSLRSTANFTIGTHSNRHYSLSSLPAADQEAQVATSIADLNRLGIEPAAVFAYPSGHFNADTINIMNKYGFKAALTNEEGLFHPGDDPLKIKRIAIGGDITRLEFKAQVSGAAYFLMRVLRPQGR